MEFLGEFSKNITRHHFDKSSKKTIDGTKIASTFKELLKKFAVDLATRLSLKQSGASVKDRALQTLRSHKLSVLFNLTVNRQI